MRALLFDFDGVLVNTEPLHMRAWQETLKDAGFSLNKKDYDVRYIGLNDRDFLNLFFRDQKKNITAALKKELISKKEAQSNKLLETEIPPIDGADDFLAYHSNIVKAIVTGAPPSTVFLVLDALGWRRHFPIVITCADVVHGKPDPEGFLKAFDKLREFQAWHPALEKKDCLILEDSPPGIEAAEKSGIPFQIVRGSLRI